MLKNKFISYTIYLLYISYLEYTHFIYIYEHLGYHTLCKHYFEYITMSVHFIYILPLYACIWTLVYVVESKIGYFVLYDVSYSEGPVTNRQFLAARSRECMCEGCVV